MNQSIVGGSYISHNVRNQTLFLISCKRTSTLNTPCAFKSRRDTERYVQCTYSVLCSTIDDRRHQLLLLMFNVLWCGYAHKIGWHSCFVTRESFLLLSKSLFCAYQRLQWQPSLLRELPKLFREVACVVRFLGI